MLPLVAISKEVGENRFQTVESYFDTGIKALGLVFGLLAIYGWNFFENTVVLPTVLMLVSLIFIGLQSIYIVDFNNLSYQNYWRFLLVRIPRGAPIHFSETKALICTRKNSVLKKLGHLQFAGKHSVSSQTNIQMNYKLFMETNLKEHVFIGEFPEEKDAAQKLLALHKKFNIECFSVNTKSSRKLNHEKLGEGKIKLNNKG